MKLTAYIHPTCPHSRDLIRLLDELKLTDFTEVIDVSESPFETYRQGILSVPALFVDNSLIASGTYEETALKAYLKLLNPVLPDNETLFRGFITAVTDNIATASYVYLYEDFAAVFENPDYLITTAGFHQVIHDNRDDFLDYIYGIVEKKFPAFLKEKVHLFHKVIAVNFLRETFWIYGEGMDLPEINRIYNSESFAHWLFVRATLGRIGIHSTAGAERIFPKSDPVWRYLSENFDELWALTLKTA